MNTLWTELEISTAITANPADPVIQQAVTEVVMAMLKGAWDSVKLLDRGLSFVEQEDILKAANKALQTLPVTTSQQRTYKRAMFNFLARLDLD